MKTIEEILSNQESEIEKKGYQEHDLRGQKHNENATEMNRRSKFFYNLKVEAYRTSVIYFDSVTDNRNAF